MKQEGWGWMKPMACMMGTESSYKIFIGKVKGKRPLGKIIITNWDYWVVKMGSD
jgi:hypothetical protein